MPYIKTIITVWCTRIEKEIPITYPGSDKWEALSRFYKSRDHEIGEKLRVEEFTYLYPWEKLYNWIRKL